MKRNVRNDKREEETSTFCRKIADASCDSQIVPVTYQIVPATYQIDAANHKTAQATYQIVPVTR